MIRIGVDVGGTGIQIGVVNREYKIIQESSIPTRTDLPFEEQLCQLGKGYVRSKLILEKAELLHKCSFRGHYGTSIKK